MEPGFLVASPQMRDANFHRTVVLLLHHDAEGAMGVVVNRESAVRLADVLDQLGGMPPVRLGGHVLWGGPVERAAGFVVFRGRAPEGWQVRMDLSVSASTERLAALVATNAEFHLCLGYAGWGPGQLEREVVEGSWVHVDATSNLIFDVPASERYDAALSRLGLTPDTLWMSPIDE